MLPERNFLTMENMQAGGMMMVKNGTFSKMERNTMAMEKMLPERNFLTTENMQTGGTMMARTGTFSKMERNLQELRKMVQELEIS